MTILLTSSFRANWHAYACIIRAMSSTNFSLRDEKQALRKSMKNILADIPVEEVVEQCAKGSRTTASIVDETDTD
jgi:phage tail protein X